MGCLAWTKRQRLKRLPIQSAECFFGHRTAPYDETLTRLAETKTVTESAIYPLVYGCYTIPPPPKKKTAKLILSEHWIGDRIIVNHLEALLFLAKHECYTTSNLRGLHLPTLDQVSVNAIVIYRAQGLGSFLSPEVPASSLHLQVCGRICSCILKHAEVHRCLAAYSCLLVCTSLSYPQVSLEAE